MKNLIIIATKSKIAELTQAAGMNLPSLELGAEHAAWPVNCPNEAAMKELQEKLDPLLYHTSLKTGLLPGVEYVRWF